MICCKRSASATIGIAGIAQRALDADAFGVRCRTRNLDRLVDHHRQIDRAADRGEPCRRRPAKRPGCRRSSWPERERCGESLRSLWRTAESARTRLHDLGPADDRVHRCPELVADDRQEFVLHAARQLRFRSRAPFPFEQSRSVGLDASLVGDVEDVGDAALDLGEPGPRRYEPPPAGRPVGRTPFRSGRSPRTRSARASRARRARGIRERGCNFPAARSDRVRPSNTRNASFASSSTPLRSVSTKPITPESASLRYFASLSSTRARSRSSSACARTRLEKRCFVRIAVPDACRKL